MSLLDAIRPGAAKPPAIPDDIKERINRGKTSIRQGATLRNECLSFWRGSQYVHRTSDGYLVRQGTVVGERPAHRPRTTRNMIHGLVESKVSAANGRTPSYEIGPSTTDPEDISAAHLAQKVALYGYQKWGVRRAVRDVITNAIVMDGGFAMPYWDATVPPYLENGIGVGDIRIRTFSGNEVGWEPGVDFDESPWHIVAQARLVDEVMAMPGYIKGEGPLTPDAQAWETLGVGSAALKNAQSKLVMVVEYLERPSAKHTQGRRIVSANERLVIPEESYPCAEYGFDGVCLHQLAYTIDPEDDRNRGLVVHLLDPQRTINNATNQQISWAQLALNPQIIGPPMANEIKFTDEPGAYYTVIPINGMTPQWRTVPPIPPELEGLKEAALGDMREIAADNNLPARLSSAQAIQAAIEKDHNRWEGFLTNVAAFHEGLMRHCLYLCQKFYTEPRLVSIRGRFGWENIPDFRGADLRNQCDVQVLASSIAPRTRQEIQNKVQWLATTFPGYVSPEAASAAIEGGAGEKLIESYELDVARANLILQKILSGPEILFAEPMVDPAQPPPWAPRPYIDNVSVHMHIFGDYMKTPAYDAAPPPTQEACRLYFQACQLLKQQQEVQAAMQQQQMATGLGMANAARPQGPAPLPSTPKAA